MLLHVLVIVLFGDAARSGARRGEGLWGPLDVTLRRLSPERGSGFKLAPGADTSSGGAAVLRRSVGAAEAPAARPRIEEHPAALSPATTDVKRIERVPESAEAAQPAPEAGPPAQLAPVEALPRINLNAPAEVDYPFAVLPPRIERELTPPVERPPREVPVAPAAPIERIAPPKIQRDLAPPVELPPREPPVAPAAPIERIAPAKIERELAPPIELPLREVPVAPAAPIERITPPKIQRELAPPIELPPREVPVAPAAPIERMAPAKIEREFAPSVEVPAPRQTPVQTATPPERVAPKAEREAAPATAPLPRSVPGETAPRVQRAAPPALAPDGTRAMQTPARTEGAPGEPLPRLPLGAPEGDEEIFKPRRDVVTPASEPGGAPHIDLEAARRQAREIAREGSGSRGVLPLAVPLPPEYRSKESRALEKAIKPDCRTAYAGLGLLAVPALVASAIGDGGCRW